MPRQIDHEQRREALAEAVWRVTLQEGIDKASVRTIARASGLSAGSLRHSFSRQDDLLTYALELVARRVQDRVGAAMERLCSGGDTLETVIAILEATLPLDDDRRADMLVWLAFADRARVVPAMQHVFVATAEGLRHICRLAVALLTGSTWLENTGAPLADEWAEAEAVKLHVWTDGLALQGLLSPLHMPPALVHRLLEEYVKGIQHRFDTRPYGPFS